jgi:GT2 family glycosyltransferase
MIKNNYYIITIHNKEELIKDVLDGIVKSTIESQDNTHIVCVLDGCTDNSEDIIDNYTTSLTDKYKIHKLHEADVHELLSLNSALRYISSIESNGESLIFLLQDDVILQEENLSETIEYLYDTYPELGYVSFRCGLSTDIGLNGVLYEHSFVESTDGHWKQLNLDHFVEMQNKEFGFCEIVIKSPTCIKKQVLDVVGLFDENLAPFGHDDLDLCIRLNMHGYKNAVFGAKFTSKLDWGGTREDKNQTKDYHKQYDQIIFRNKLYLTEKHKHYYATKQK